MPQHGTPRREKTTPRTSSSSDSASASAFAEGSAPPPGAPGDGAASPGAQTASGGPRRAPAPPPAPSSSSSPKTPPSPARRRAGGRAGAFHIAAGPRSAGCCRFKEGDFEGARKKFTDVITATGYTPDLAYNVALCYYKMKQFGAALKHCNSAVFAQAKR